MKVKKGSHLFFCGVGFLCTREARYGYVTVLDNDFIYLVISRNVQGGLRQRAYSVRRSGASAERLRRVLKAIGYSKKGKWTQFCSRAVLTTLDGVDVPVETRYGELIGEQDAVLGLSISHIRP